MRFTFTVEVEISRQQGKFATRDEMADQIREAIEGADPQSLQGESDGEYNVDSWDVQEQEQEKRQPKRRRKTIKNSAPDASVFPSNETQKENNLETQTQ
jgi:hypothetical protein